MKIQRHQTLYHYLYKLDKQSFLQQSARLACAEVYFVSSTCCCGIYQYKQ